MCKSLNEHNPQEARQVRNDWHNCSLQSNGWAKQITTAEDFNFKLVLKTRNILENALNHCYFNTISHLGNAFPDIWNKCSSHNLLDVTKTTHTHSNDYSWQTWGHLCITLAFSIVGTKHVCMLGIRRLCLLMRKSILDSNIWLQLHLHVLQSLNMYRASKPGITPPREPSAELNQSKDACVTSTWFAQKMPWRSFVCPWLQMGTNLGWKMMWHSPRNVSVYRDLLSWVGVELLELTQHNYEEKTLSH